MLIRKHRKVEAYQSLVRPEKDRQKNGRNGKLEWILLMLAALFFAQTVLEGKEPGAGRKNVPGQEILRENRDEQEEITKTKEGKEEQPRMVVKYVSGSSKVLQNQGREPVATPTLPADLPPTDVVVEVLEQVPVLTQIPVEDVPASGGYISMFSPDCYPKLSEIIGKKYYLSELKQLSYLKNNFYIVNNTTKMTESEFDVEYFLNADLSIAQSQEPQILIYHTHGTEGFADSREGESEDTVIGMGELLAEFLREKYGYNVLHDTTLFDWKDGKSTRNSAYNNSLPYLEELLKEYPNIEVIIDLHRDAGSKRVATIDGKQVAKVMLFNGLCRNTQGKLTYLPNENLADNLAFSFQMKLIGDEMYPGLMHKIFLKDYRYNMHLAERYLLIELGTDENTVEEAKNAMEPLADVLAQVLGGNLP